MSAFAGAAFSEQAFDPNAFDFGGFVNVSFSSGAFSKDVAFSSSAFSFDGAAVISLRPGRVYKGKYPYFTPRRKPYWEQSDAEEEEFLLLSSIDLD